jgi:hypothetical protein
MGFKENPALFLFVLLCGSMCSGKAAGEVPEITVLLQNRVKLPQTVLKQAEAEVARILGAAGIHVRWVDCMKTDMCHHVPTANEIVRSIVSDGRTSNDMVYGIAFLGPAGEGKYSDVFFRRIEAACSINGEKVARFLGTVAAHELGHLLLGSHAHTYEGVMSAVWREPTLRRMNMGTLLFTGEESMAMKARLAGEGASRDLPEYTRTRTRSLIP